MIVIAILEELSFTEIEGSEIKLSQLYSLLPSLYEALTSA